MPRKKGTPDPESFSFGDVVKWTNATRSNLIWWTNAGIIKADVEDSTGPGHARRFSALNLVEAELAYHINRFKVPVKLLGRATSGVRDLHEQSAAVWNSEPGLTSQQRLSDAQRAALKEAYIRAFQRRDIVCGGKPAAAKYYEQHVDWQQALYGDNERAILENARAWRRFVLTPHDANDTYFVALFPGEDYASVGTLPDLIADMKQNIAAITVNLAPIFEYIRSNVLGPLVFFKSLRVPYE